MHKGWVQYDKDKDTRSSFTFCMIGFFSPAETSPRALEPPEASGCPPAPSSHQHLPCIVSGKIVELGSSNYYATLSVSKGVVQRKKESQSSVTCSTTDELRPGPLALAVWTGMKDVLFT